MDFEYIQQSPVCKHLLKGLAAICTRRPVDPIHYLAILLLKYDENERLMKLHEEEAVLLLEAQKQRRAEKERTEAMRLKRRKELARESIMEDVIDTVNLVFRNAMMMVMDRQQEVINLEASLTST